MEHETSKAQQLVRTVNTSLAFGIIEVLVSGIIVITVIGASVSVRQRASSEATFARHQVVANMLAQEGLEAVRQIRDTNYLTKTKNLSSDSPVKRAWNCDLNLNTALQADTANDPNGTGSTIYFQQCNPNAGLAQAALTSSNNVGDFSYVNRAGGVGTSANTLELENGMQFATTFRNDLNPTQAILLPSWNLAAPAGFDGGANPPAGQTGLSADRCVGMERIFVKEGTSNTPVTNPVLSNLRLPGKQLQNLQLNNTGAAGNCDTLTPSGYFEYRRQVLITAGGSTTEMAGNLPSAWSGAGNNTQTHEIRVMVRVSWSETNRLDTNLDVNGVLLATYLTDWRPSN